MREKKQPIERSFFAARRSSVPRPVPPFTKTVLRRSGKGYRTERERFLD
jgi:hypothetical protein